MNEERRLRFICEQSYANAGIAFYGILDRLVPGDKRARIASITYEDIDEESPAMWPAPAFVMTREHAQELMDSLYNCGIRPSDAGESVGALSATKFHLEDMRKIVFDIYGDKEGE